MTNDEGIASRGRGWLALWAFVIRHSAFVIFTPLLAQEDLTPLLHTPEAWDDPTLSAGWHPTLTEAPRLFRTRAVPCRIVGRDAHSVTGGFENGRLTSLTIVLLDSGAWFGYVPDDRARAVASERGAEFSHLFRAVATDVPRQLEAVAGAGREVELGSTKWLRQKALLYHCRGLGARLTLVSEALVKLSLFRESSAAPQLLAPFRTAGDKAAVARQFAAAVRTTPAGDRLIDGLPVFPQGDRAYCGVSALAMAMRFAGLTLDTEDFAAGAGIRYGSTAKSHIREVYGAAAREAGLSMHHSTKFDFARAQQSVEAGFPVLVFRRWSQARDYLHTAFAQRFATDPTAELPRPDANDRKSWPTRDSFAHASVVNGCNAKRREVILTESWSEHARNRRMRLEELEATAYLAYYPRL